MIPRHTEEKLSLKTLPKPTKEDFCVNIRRNRGKQKFCKTITKIRKSKVRIKKPHEIHYIQQEQK